MIRDGLAHPQRLKAELRGDYFQLDQLSFEQLLFLATEYATWYISINLISALMVLWHLFLAPMKAS